MRGRQRSPLNGFGSIVATCSCRTVCALPRPPARILEAVLVDDTAGRSLEAAARCLDALVAPDGDGVRTGALDPRCRLRRRRRHIAWVLLQLHQRTIDDDVVALVVFALEAVLRGVRAAERAAPPRIEPRGAVALDKD